MKKTTEKPQPRKSNPLLFLIPYILLALLAGLVFANFYIKQQIAKTTLPVRLAQTAFASYPSFRFFYEPYLSAQGAIIMDNTSKRVLYAKSPNLRLSTASTAKIMTALVALEYFRPNDELTVTEGDIEGTVVGFPKGAHVYFDDMLYALLLASGNDAAYAIAANYPGGKEAFVDKMNQKAKHFHLQNTHFADPAGLNDDESFTTVVDLARLCALAMEDKTFARVVGTKQKVFNDLAGNTYQVDNLNRLLGNYGVVGIKTGQTIGAGGVLTTAKIENGRQFILVVMQSTDRFGDTVSLLNLITNNITYFVPQPWGK